MSCSVADNGVVTKRPQPPSATQPKSSAIVPQFSQSQPTEKMPETMPDQILVKNSDKILGKIPERIPGLPSTSTITMGTNQKSKPATTDGVNTPFSLPPAVKNYTMPRSASYISAQTKTTTKPSFTSAHTTTHTPPSLARPRTSSANTLVLNPNVKFGEKVRPLTHTHSLSHSLSRSLSLWLTLTLAFTLIPALTLTLARSPSFTLSHSITHSHMLSHLFTLALTCTHTHTPTHSPTHSPPPLP